MRYVLIVVAIGAALVLAWLSVTLGLAELNNPRPEHEPDYSILGMLATAALVMVAAAGGLIARRAEGAYLLSIAAFMLVIPLSLLAFLTLMAGTSPYNMSDPGLLRLLGPGLLALDLAVAVLGIRLGRKLNRDRSALQASAPGPS